MKSKKPVISKSRVSAPKAAPVVSRVSGLSVKDVCDIIDKCNQAKVSSLDFGDLSLTFGQSTDERTGNEQEAAVPTAPKPGRPLTPEEQRAAHRQAAVAADHGGVIVQSEIELELEQLKVTDPVEYERRVNSGELV